MREDIVKTISELESLNIAQSILYVRINDEFCHTKDLTAKMERITKAGLLSLLCRQSLDGLKIKVVVEMKIVKIFPMNE